MERQNTVLSLPTLRGLVGKLVYTSGSHAFSRSILKGRCCTQDRWGSFIESRSWGWIMLMIVAGVVGGWLLLHNVRPTLSAGSIVVTTTDDELNSDGDCSLREAIQAVNTQSPVDACPTGSSNDTITLSAGVYTLNIAGAGEDNNATGDLDIFATASAVTRTLIIQGDSATTTIVDGNQLDRVFHLVARAPIGFQDDLLVLRDLTVRNGRLSGAGGAGLLSWGRLELYNVIIENNATTGTSSSNIGGGFCIGCGTGTGSGYLEHVIVRNNAAQRGGGVFSNRPLTITASSIISNTAFTGGAIVNYGALTLTNVTVSDNTASSYLTGGIVHSAGSLSILNSTISHNTNYGISFDAPATLKNTLLANNIPGKNCYVSTSISTPPTSQGYNLSNDNSCASLLMAGGDQNNVDPQLGPLQNNGGFTPTRALALTSPAVNAGTNSDCPATDQRGVARPQDGTCDIGAYEFQVQRVHLPLVVKQS